MAMWIKKVTETPISGNSDARIINSLDSDSEVNAPSIHAVNDAFTGWFSSVTNTNESNVANNTPIDVAPRITIPTDGLYIVIGYVEWVGSSVGNRSVRINNNTEGLSDYISTPASTENVIRHQIVIIHSFSENDAVSLGVRQSSGDVIQITKRKLTIYRLSKNTFNQ